MGDEKKINNVVSQVDVSDLESSSYNKEEAVTQTVRGLKPRHIQLIALGGAIGTGLFVGSGAALSTCGPAPLFMSYIFMSFMVWTVMNQLGEMATFLPLPGEATLYAMARRYAGDSFAFTSGWNIYYAQAIIVPAEITAVAFVIEYWTDANSAIFISIFIVCSVALNVLPVKYYGESEFWVSTIKLLCLTGLIIVGIVIFFGGGPAQTGVLGFHYWKTPGAFTEHLVSGNTGRFLALWTAIIKSGFSFILMPEVITATAAEAVYPRRNLPKACDRFIYRLAFFYICGTLVIGVIIGYNDPRLMDAVAAGASGAAGSPFVIGIQNAGISVLPHIINACILTSAYSCGTSLLYGSSRGLYSMALQGDAPKIFAKVNRYGVPIYAVGLTSCFTLLAYLNCSNSAATVFTWLSNIATVSGFISWILVSLTYIQYRKVIKFHGLDSRVPYRPKIQMIGAYSSVFLFTLISLTNGYAVFFPDNWNVSDFFAAYCTILILFVLFIGSIIFYKDFKIFKHPKDVDVFALLDRAEQEEADDKIVYEAEAAEKQTLLHKIWRWIA